MMMFVVDGRSYLYLDKQGGKLIIGVEIVDFGLKNRGPRMFYF